MKNSIFIIVLLLVHMATFAQEGVNFEDLTFDEALAKAKAENKFVFVDCYTSWCGPCKYMAQAVVPQKSMGDFFNPRFGSVKFDMERGEGKELNEKFGVKAYPTFLILRPDGTLQHKIVGGTGMIEMFIEKVERGLNEKTSLDYLDKKYEKGKLNKKELVRYQIALLDANEEMKSGKVLEELNVQLNDEDKLQKEFWPILKKEVYGSEGFKFVLDHSDVLYKNVGKEQIDSYLMDNFFRAIDGVLNAATRTSGETLKQVQEELARVDITNEEVLWYAIELNQACLANDLDQLISIAEDVRDNDNNKVWFVMRAFMAIEQKVSEVDLKRMIRLENRYLELVSGDGREQVAGFFQKLKRDLLDGVNFQSLSYEDALKEASRQGRMLFVYCRINSCPPCDGMENDILKKEDIKKCLEDNYVCVKYDMKVGEGLVLAKKWNMEFYPVCLLVNPDGGIRHRIEGLVDPEFFLEQVKEGLNDK